MLINGEKFACEACVRGHRVSSCHHQDRPLVHVNKKGRPVSQCQHCRGLRKSRASHVKCECHDKGHTKDDCPHEKGDSKTDGQTCCCQHGNKCTCSIKKEHLDPVMEDLPQLIQPKEPHKRLSNMNSHESKATVFTNGHHKPVHKFNDAHNHVGAPYHIPSRTHTSHGIRELAQRSTDSLPLPKTTKVSHESPLHNSMTPSEAKRRVRSEHNSPMLGPVRGSPMGNTTDFLIPAYDPNAYSYSPFNNPDTSSIQINNPPEALFPEQFPESWFMSYEQAHEYEPPPHALSSDTPPMDWSSFNLEMSNAMPDPNMNSTNFMSSQPQSLTAFEPFSHLNPGLTSSSGEISEAEDYVPRARADMARSASREASNDINSANGDDGPERYRMSSTSSYYGTPQPNLLAGDTTNSLDIDDFLRQAEAETQKMRLQNQLQQQLQSRSVPSPQPSRVSVTSQGFSPQIPTLRPEHSLTVHEAQEMAHDRDGPKPGFNLARQTIDMPVASMAADPAWSLAPDLSNPSLVLDDEKDDEDWVR